jgi:hypothetical protein
VMMNSFNCRGGLVKANAAIETIRDAQMDAPKSYRRGSGLFWLSGGWSPEASSGLLSLALVSWRKCLKRWET